jgi:hypothetical protein
VPLVVGGGVVALLLLSVLILASLSKRTSTGEPDGSAGTSGSSALPTRPGNTQVYKDVRFTFPGDRGCSISQGVVFTVQGPQVDTDSRGDNELEYDCSGTQPTLAPGYGDALAVVTSAPDAPACVNATDRQPIVELAFADLKVGMHLCLVTYDPHQIDSLTLAKKKTSSYALTFSVTVWSGK